MHKSGSTWKSSKRDVLQLLRDATSANTDVSLMENTAGEAGDSGDEPTKSQTDPEIDEFMAGGQDAGNAGDESLIESELESAQDVIQPPCTKVQGMKGRLKVVIQAKL